MNILLSAFAFEPSESSEPGVAWRFAKIALRGNHRVWVLTADFPTCVARTRAHLERNPEPGLEVVPFWPKGIRRSNDGRGVNRQYWMWQRQVAGVAADLHRKHRFDVAHHVTFGRYWTPSSLCKLPLPFVWGPLGSAESTPRSFLPGLPLKNRLQSLARDLVRKISERDPLLRQCARKSFAAFATTEETLRRVRALGARNASFLPQVFFPEERFRHLAAQAPAQPCPPLRMLSIGRSLYWKGFQYGLGAAAELRRRGVAFEYRIVGTGPFLPELKARAEREGIADQVEFVPRIEGDIAPEIGRCHALVHPALHETFGNVCLEALAVGRPVYCLDTGGPAVQVTPACGFAAPTESPARAEIALARKLEEIALDPSLREEMSRQAQARARARFHQSGVESVIGETYRAAAA